MNGNSLKEHILLNEMKLEKLYCRPHQIITDILDSSILTVCMFVDIINKTKKNAALVNMDKELHFIL
jgi:hypothetical protein